MSLGERLRRRTDTQLCGACGSKLVPEGTFCHVCGVRIDDPDAQPLHIVDRQTGLFNDRFLRPILEDELTRAFRYGRSLGVLLLQAIPAPDVITTAEVADEDEDDQVLHALGGAIARTLRDVDTPGVLGHHPPTILALLPDTDMSGTAHAARRVIEATDQDLAPLGKQTVLGIVCCHWGQRLRASAVIDAAHRALESDHPELLGR
ncbi:MAG: diguanylate cyclase [Candidatus Dormibacteraeota bacterium]|nr:diguanylate cyclase [Candidatus Dormibacteraeota bacterium]